MGEYRRAPLFYSSWGPAGVAGGFSPAPRRTVQQFEMADDLGDSNPASPQYRGNAIPVTYRSAGAIWPAAGSTVNLFIYADTPQQVDTMIVPPPGAPALATITGVAGPLAPLTASFRVSAEGSHLLTVRLSFAGAASARLYVKCDYLAPSSSLLF